MIDGCAPHHPSMHRIIRMGGGGRLPPSPAAACRSGLTYYAYLPGPCGALTSRRVQLRMLPVCFPARPTLFYQSEAAHQQAMQSWHNKSQHIDVTGKAEPAHPPPHHHPHPPPPRCLEAAGVRQAQQGQGPGLAAHTPTTPTAT